ncbi:MAG: UDP-N-acetylglucosamine 1-carboxyvinyltransferase, partial [Proteobacteria bacterium]|nr:UDP-N-acetylglucosamine 1-carboxyvinyltransferase [Pseudomonadota bacterium]
MEKFVIIGGKPLHGEIDVRGAKNAAFPILAATILTKEDCTISNLPLIEDVLLLLNILERMGAEVKWKGKRTVIINTKKLDPSKIDSDLICRFRGSVLLYGPLLARFKKAYLPQPGGCIIGARPIDTHLDAFAQLGVKITQRKGGFILEAPKKLTNNKV